MHACTHVRVVMLLPHACTHLHPACSRTPDRLISAGIHACTRALPHARMLALMHAWVGHAALCLFGVMRRSSLSQGLDHRHGAHAYARARIRCRPASHGHSRIQNLLAGTAFRRALCTPAHRHECMRLSCAGAQACTHAPMLIHETTLPCILSLARRRTLTHLPACMHACAHAHLHTGVYPERAHFTVSWIGQSCHSDKHTRTHAHPQTFVHACMASSPTTNCVQT